METKIKIYGPPIDKAIDKLQELAEELPTVTQGNLSRSVIPLGETIMGDFDFVFHWAKKRDEKQLRELITRIDDALIDIGCRYTVTTTDEEDHSANPYRV